MSGADLVVMVTCEHFVAKPVALWQNQSRSIIARFSSLKIVVVVFCFLMCDCPWPFKLF
jgi:hypothetical protein